MYIEDYLKCSSKASGGSLEYYQSRNRLKLVFKQISDFLNQYKAKLNYKCRRDASLA